MRLLALLAVLLLAGCLAGPNRVSGLPETCPSWIEGSGGPQVSAQFSPRFPADWRTIDFDGGNATRAAKPLESGETLELPDGSLLTQDRIELDFTWGRSPNGNPIRRGIELNGADLHVQFTHGAGAPDEGRVLPFYVIGLEAGSRTVRGEDGKERRELIAFDEFTFRSGLWTNFTIHVLLDRLDGSPDPAGAFAIWEYAPQTGQDLATLPASTYIYRAVGLYDRCE